MRLLALFALFVCATTALAQVGRNQGLLDPNLADRAELLALPHMDEALVDTLIAVRPINSAMELNEVLATSLSNEQRREVFARLFRQIDLNDAEDEVIMLIPGMSERMAHEFEEYRPYASLEQFRREIGKYVDEDELARLEQYVFIPLDLNSASEDALMTIPGMTRRMAHEFEEYRPYASLEQFRREIGKYVDEDEVSRLESYVRLED